MGKAVVVPFQSLSEDSLFIKAANLPSYNVYQKSGKNTALILGSDRITTFHEADHVIIVSMTMFGNLNLNHQLVFAFEAAAKPAGFEAPKDIYIKTDQGKISYLGENGPIGQFNVYPDSTKVIDLAHIFNVRIKPVTYLNIGE